MMAPSGIYSSKQLITFFFSVSEPGSNNIIFGNEVMRELADPGRRVI